jgi:hypothetical protein
MTQLVDDWLVLDDHAPFVPLVMTKCNRETGYEAKAVTLAGRRYIICRNQQEAENKNLWTVEQTPDRQAPTRHPADLSQAERDHPRSRVLQLPCARAQEGVGRSHRCARLLSLLARDHCRSRLADRDRDRARRKTLRRAFAPRPVASLALRAAGVAPREPVQRDVPTQSGVT